ncbi:hypothetical protein EJB05_12802 [Eragrostis curvula]|uniref:Uncharacterized protein n=1 Tax=Eragrostis curvula TaxID=38414 RepID=A0A5J9VU14_9POAL|nr:hypothetical protein EJB05_12802 [Eragrostis curvula]
MWTPSKRIVSLFLTFTLVATTVQPSDAIRVLQATSSTNADAVAKPTGFSFPHFPFPHRRGAPPAAGDQFTVGLPFPPLFPLPGAPGFPFPSFPPLFPLPGAPPLVPIPGLPPLPPIPGLPHLPGTPPASSTRLSAQSISWPSSSLMGLMHGTAGPVPPMSSPASAPSPAPSPYSRS